MNMDRCTHKMPDFSKLMERGFHLAFLTQLDSKFRLSILNVSA